MKQVRGAWAEQEIQYIRNHYKTVSRHELAAALGRTVASVDWKTHTLGLSKKEDPKRNRTILHEKWV